MKKLVPQTSTVKGYGNNTDQRDQLAGAALWIPWFEHCTKERRTNISWRIQRFPLTERHRTCGGVSGCVSLLSHEADQLAGAFRRTNLQVEHQHNGTLDLKG